MTELNSAIRFIDNSADDDDSDTDLDNSPTLDPATDDPASDSDVATQSKNSKVDVDWKKRYDDLRPHLDAISKENKVLKVENASLKAKGTPFDLPATEEDVEKIFQEYPEFARLSTIIARKTLEKNTSELTTKVQQLEEERRKERMEMGKTIFSTAHPDAKKIVNSPEFKTWLGKQSTRIKELVNSEDVYEAIEGMNLYKAHAGIAATKAPRKEGAAHVKTNSAKDPVPSAGKIWKESEIQKMSDKAYEASRAEITAARLENRIVYDLSGAA